MNTNKIHFTKYMPFLYLFILGLYFVTRLLFLDSDLPPWGIINYQPVDEGAYSMLALNLYNYGDISPEIFGGEIEYITSPHIRTNILGNIVIYISLCVFGDNYWGLRISSVFCGFVILLLFWGTINALLSQYNVKNQIRQWINLGCLFYFILDFNFVMACRVVETSIFRLLFIMIIIFLFVKTNKNIFFKFTLITFIATLSIFGIYITNIFVYLAIFIAIVGYGIKCGKKAFKNGILGIICGGALGLIPLEIYYVSVWNTGAIKNMFNSILSFSFQTGYTSSSSLRTLLKTTVHFFASNSNLYNIVLLAIMVLSIPFLIFLIKKKKDLNILFFLALIVSLYCQTLFSEDYIVRKYIIIYPIYFLLLVTLIAYKNDLKEWIHEMLTNSHAKRNKLIMSIYIVLAIVFCIIMIWFRFFRISDGTINDFSKKDILILSIIGIVSLIFLFGGIYYFIKNNKKMIICFAVCFLCGITTHLYLNFTYIYINPTYTERQCMIDIGQTVGDGYVIGSFFPMGYTLYNNIKPIITSADQIAIAMEKHNEIWCLDYSDTNSSDMHGYLDSLFVNSIYQLNNYCDYYRKFSTFGSSRDVALYKIEFKNNTGD